MLLWVLLVTGLILGYLNWRAKNRKLLAISRELPGPPTVPILGNAMHFVNQDLIVALHKITAEYGDLMRFWLGPDLNIVTSDPDDLKILLTSPKTAAKGIQYKYMADVLGGGILSGSGPVWRRHRKIATPNYGKRAVESFTDQFNQEVDLLLDRFQGLVIPGKTVDMYSEVVKTTSYTVCQCLMGLTREETLRLPHIQEIIDVTPDMYDVVFERMTKWWQQIDPVFWMSSSYQFQKRFLTIIKEFSKAVIENRNKLLKDMVVEKELVESQEDSLKNTQISVIDRFILSQELDPTEMLQETFTIFTSSQEATAKITSFLLLMMAYHTDCQDRLYQEIIEVVGEESSVSEDHLRRMPYLEMVFKEIIRLFPIGAVLQRSVIEDITINKTTIPAGCSLVIPIYHIQRDPRYWQNPNAFDPERFTPDNSKGRPAYAYIPFSLGPMDCLGRHFGTKLVKTIAIKMLQNYKLTSNTTYDEMENIIAISVTSVNGFKAILTPRTKAGKSDVKENRGKFQQKEQVQQNGLK